MTATALAAGMRAGPDTDSCLGVERSIGGRRWRTVPAPEGAGAALAQRLGLPEIVGRLLAARGVGLDDAASFLDPRLAQLLPDPSGFRDMDKAAVRLARAIQADEPIAVFGDYDVDGATSAALLHRFAAAVGVSLRLYIPDRIGEGYGPNEAALLRLKAEGVGLVVTVDCGVTAHAPLAAAAAAGLDVIVVDHHEAEPELPPAFAVIDPNRLDEDAEIGGRYGRLAAVGVAFLLTVALNRALRRAGWYGSARPEPDLMQWLDLVALGTVCDVVPLTGLNRAFVAQGLKVMARRGNPGLAALADVAGLAAPPGAYHAGFVLGPRVNAGGRIGAADLGVRLLATDDTAEAARLAARLDELNRERRAIERTVLEAAIAEAERGPGAGPVFAAGEGWHPGVIGIVAGRLKERYGRPACVVALADGIGRGSGRSIAGVDLGAAVIAARQAGLLVNGGGHAMAAGFTVAADKLPALAAFLADRLAAAVAGRLPVLAIDGAVGPAAATLELAAQVARLGPFGSGNPEPRFVIPAVRILRADPVGADHVRCVLAGGDGARLDAIAFRAFETGLGQALLQGRGAALHLAGHLRAEVWQGRERLRFLIEDAAPAFA